MSHVFTYLVLDRTLSPLPVMTGHQLNIVSTKHTVMFHPHTHVHVLLPMCSFCLKYTSTLLMHLDGQHIVHHSNKQQLLLNMCNTAFVTIRIAN